MGSCVGRAVGDRDEGCRGLPGLCLPALFLVVQDRHPGSQRHWEWEPGVSGLGGSETVCGQAGVRKRPVQGTVLAWAVLTLPGLGSTGWGGRRVPVSCRLLKIMLPAAAIVQASPAGAARLPPLGMSALAPEG